MQKGSPVDEHHHRHFFISSCWSEYTELEAVLLSNHLVTVQLGTHGGRVKSLEGFSLPLCCRDRRQEPKLVDWWLGVRHPVEGLIVHPGAFNSLSDYPAKSGLSFYSFY